MQKGGKKTMRNPFTKKLTTEECEASESLQSAQVGTPVGFSKPIVSPLVRAEKLANDLRKEKRTNVRQKKRDQHPKVIEV